MSTLFVLILILLPTQGKEKVSKTYANTRKLLAGMDTSNTGSRGNKLAKVFRIGDERINDLIAALNDKDESISLHAQIAIRYLGNQQGMKALQDRYYKGTENRSTGPIPLPLAQWDYDFINRNYLNESRLSWGIPRYIYALALDASPKSASTLDRMLEKYGQPPRFSLERIRMTFASSQDLAQEVFKNAFFISPEDKKYSTALLLAYNGAKDKALIEIYINRGVLMEEWHHVVISKSEQGWKFYSVTMVAQS
jgi:hypothetical protein